MFRATSILFAVSLLFSACVDDSEDGSGAGGCGGNGGPAEICDNGIDDDTDGKLDCTDLDSPAAPACPFDVSQYNDDDDIECLVATA